MGGNIVDSYLFTIGQTNEYVWQSFDVAKKSNRTFWSRVQEALRDAKRPDTQKEAARIAHVSQPTVSDWNKPNGFPTIENTVALATELKVCVDWLLTERGPKWPGPPEDKEARKLWSLWSRLDKGTKGRLAGIAEEHVRSQGYEDSGDVEESRELQRG